MLAHNRAPCHFLHERTNPPRPGHPQPSRSQARPRRTPVGMAMPRPRKSRRDRTPSKTTPPAWERAVAWAVVAGVVIMALGAGLAIVRSVSDAEVAAPDVIMVLGGGEGERLALGRDLADRHEVPLVLSEGAILQAWRAGLACEEPIHCELADPSATRGEARRIAALAETNGWDHVVVVTTRFHVGRTRLLMDQCLDSPAVVGAPMRFTPAPAPAPPRLRSRSAGHGRRCHRAPRLLNVSLKDPRPRDPSRTPPHRRSRGGRLPPRPRRPGPREKVDATDPAESADRPCTHRPAAATARAQRRGR